MKYYILNETELADLLAASIKLEALEADGVDNWIGYMETADETIESCLEENDIYLEDVKDIDFYDAAEMIIEAGAYMEYNGD